MSKTILIVEDNELNMKLFNDLLQAHGYSTVQTMDGRDAIRLARENSPDLVLMDIQLPDIDGIQAFKKLQTFKETNGIPVIALSANAMKHQVEEVMSLGFKFYLTKPINIKQLLEKIDQYWQATGSEKQ